MSHFNETRRNKIETIAYICFMTTTQLKKEIGKVLDRVPEKLLQDILDLLKEVESEKTTNSRLASNLKNILSEDSELLNKLAQ